MPSVLRRQVTDPQGRVELAPIGLAEEIRTAVRFAPDPSDRAFTNDFIWTLSRRRGLNSAQRKQLAGIVVELGSEEVQRRADAAPRLPRGFRSAYVREPRESRHARPIADLIATADPALLGPHGLPFIAPAVAPPQARSGKPVDGNMCAHLTIVCDLQVDRPSALLHLSWVSTEGLSDRQLGELLKRRTARGRTILAALGVWPWAVYRDREGRLYPSGRGDSIADPWYRRPEVLAALNQPRAT